MDTSFCVFWQGNRRAKFCRICAVEGSSCFELWEAVKTLAERKLVLVNKKPGRAFGHKYRIEKPGKSHCYLQTLQDKMSHFGLPIEDFLYVTKTGLGGMYEAPSRTKQNPFVNLLLEQIVDNLIVPNGAELIAAVRTIPRKTKLKT